MAIGVGMSREVYWHLPGFMAFRSLNMSIIDLMSKYPDYFEDGYKVGSVYGTFPGAIWNGGRTVLGFTPKNDMEIILRGYNKKDVPVRFTWTNSLLTEKHVHDTYCNLIMRMGNNGMNQVLVNTPVLEEYLRNNYPDYKFISSTTKRITDAQALYDELAKDYFMVVLDYDLNHNEEVLTALEPQASRVEILVDEICFPGCNRRVEHYKDESLKQLEYEIANPFPCQNRQSIRSFEDSMSRPAFISKEEVKAYSERGFENFKIVGRGLPQKMVEDSYMYYLVKDERREQVRGMLREHMAKKAEKAKAKKSIGR